MEGLNKVIIVGTLGSDPKNNVSKDGLQFTTLSLATNKFRKNKEGVSERKADWHRVAVFGKKAELCQEYLKKGAPVCVEGYLSTYEQEEEDGKKRYFTSITAEKVEFIPVKNMLAV